MPRRRIIRSRVPPQPQTVALVDYLASRFTYLSPDRWRDEIAAGRILLDDARVTDPGRLLYGGELLAWHAGPIAEPTVDEGVAVLYEEEDWIAVNKTGNLPVHPSGRYFHHTLTALLEERCGRRVYPAHRLDRETSGVVLLAFDGKTAGKLAGALIAGTKEYLALVHGHCPAGEWTVDLPLGRAAGSAIAKKRLAWPGGEEKAVTRFRKILTVADISLIRCFPETGRLHQIRAHLSAAGYPIVGDKLYGRDEKAFLEFLRDGSRAELEKSLLLPRQALHAVRVTLTHPRTGLAMTLRAPLPKMFADFIRVRKTTLPATQLFPA
ncbi:MAG: RluA family pseudouridine synthase [Deltaproteobacteria bacterium]|jgi:23S rRNA pseudouridine955/2504/2580 synthase/23S rRNA pseudouridine1911/1915/1917 synthase